MLTPHRIHVSYLTKPGGARRNRGVSRLRDLNVLQRLFRYELVVRVYWFAGKAKEIVRRTLRQEERF